MVEVIRPGFKRRRAGCEPDEEWRVLAGKDGKAYVFQDGLEGRLNTKKENLTVTMTNNNNSSYLSICKIPRAGSNRCRRTL